MPNRYGWGRCPHCGRDIGATKTGKAIRHGFIRIKKGYKRRILRNCEGGHDYYPCEGSGKPLRDWYSRRIVDSAKTLLEAMQ